ncbi:MFS transporter [Chryseolinea sp. H1M3-3]|uniref:MFS transporter n=1 Tax=Chryseolinea sp. H1M3-3 TaxID=3034144 RepID=UPI0023EAD363|nr:MFS transporter [Chryseolinea sp. H1M3-3]
MKEKVFSRYEVFVIAMVTIVQFTVVLDFMVLSPLGAILMPELNITPAQFGMVVSAYAFSAGASGLLAAGFADRFDRKKLLLFFYGGFIIGTTFCAVAPDYHDLMLARIITGIFGGVLSSISFAIITDLFKLEVRGRVMGFVQMAFASSQVLGIPIGLYFANLFGWHSPFIMLVGICVVAGLLIIVFMRPIDAHLKIPSTRNPFQHLIKTISKLDYLRAFAATTLLATGGFMLMPFASAFSVNNLGITLEQLPMLYMVTGVFSMITGPLVGKFSDQVGKYNIFMIGSLITMVVVGIYCNLGITPLWIVLALNVIMFAGVSSRIISSSALLTAVPLPQDRGAFMSINSSVQQISGGIATFIAGLIVVQTPNGKLEHYDTLGYVVIGAMLITIIMMYTIHVYVEKKSKSVIKPQPAPVSPD